MTIDLQPHLLNALQVRMTTYLSQMLPPAHETPTRLHEAMRYAVLNGGKRIRPLLVYATGLCFSVELAMLDAPAAAIELIHAYSLVHDDLPSMDDDDYRRDQLSCHKAFDESTAILAGDALQSLAFAQLTKKSPHFAAQQLQMVACLSEASGSYGMAGGQQLDLQHQHHPVAPEMREHIHRLKTGALFRAAVQLGAIAGHCDDTTLRLLDEWADCLGLAFQLQDDQLDDLTPHQRQIDQLFQRARHHLHQVKGDITPLLAVWEYLSDREV